MPRKVKRHDIRPYPQTAATMEPGGDIERVELHGIGHMGLLNDPRVFA